MSGFASAVTAWAGFYALAGTVAGALAALLFVTVSLHVDLLARDDGRGFRTLARQTLTNFVVVTMISLVFQIPAATPLSLGLPLLAMGIVGCAEETRLGLQIRGPDQTRLSTVRRDLLYARLVLPAAAYGVLVAVALILMSGSTDALDWAVAALIVILLSATVASWTMLIDLSRLRLSQRSASVGAEHLDDGGEGIERLDGARIDHQIHLGEARLAK
jgi:hypothetical protein